jgi:RNA polymerase sigma-70 factor (ECF subfamily)
VVRARLASTLRGEENRRLTSMPPEDPLAGRQLARLSASGDSSARTELLAGLYEDLRLRARRYMRGQRPDHTLQTTALVNEACLRLLGQDGAPWNGRDHVLALAASAMRSVLVDHARARLRAKRSAPGLRVPLDELIEGFQEKGVDVLALDEALGRLAAFDPLMAQAVELRFFAAQPVEDAARILGLPKRTFERHWSAARAWLRAELT